ncbi:MAG: ATP-binding protein [Anaerolineae bacterium]
MPHAPLPLDPAALPANAPLVVAVSGGPDSVALLAALRDIAPERGIVLHVAHLDHGLRPEAVDDAAFVARLAADWGLAATVDAVDVRAFAAASGRGIEDAARHARYAFLAGVARRVAGRYGGARVDVATATRRTTRRRPC